MTVPPAATGFGPGANSDERLFTFLPVSVYERLPAIKHAARVGTYNVHSQIDGRRVSGQFMGVDPDQFHKVAYWRWDFSDYRFGSLMNALGSHANGVLVPNSLLNNSTLNVGDAIRYILSLGGSNVEFEGVVVGSFDYFPTWYPAEENLLIVGNLTNVFEVAGGEFLYQVWAESDSPIEAESFRSGVARQQLFGTFWDEARPLVTVVQSQPQRQGLFGLLSVGFYHFCPTDSFRLFSVRAFLSATSHRRIGCSAGGWSLKVKNDAFGRLGVGAPYHLWLAVGNNFGSID